MIYLILLLVVLAIIIGPQLWVKRVISKHNNPRDDIPGSGGQFAHHLLHKLELADKVNVEATDGGDHYDPRDKKVRLGKNHYECNSITALTIAAHEVGHAMQDAENNRWLNLRSRLVILAGMVEKVAPVALTLAPILLAVTRSPLLSFAVLTIGFAAIALTSLMHFITLPVELDASFNKALPILREGGYLPQDEDYQAAHSILRAAAMTYVAQSLFNLLNIGYWMRILLR